MKPDLNSIARAGARVGIGGRRPTSSRRVVAFLLLAPAVALFGVFFAWPLTTILLRSLSPEGKASLSADSVTLEHYAALVDQPALRAVLWNTVSIAALSTTVSVALAYPTAYFFSRLQRRTAGLLMTFVLLSFWTSILIRLYAFTQILGRRGVVNEIAGAAGLGPFELLFNRVATIIGMAHYLTPFLILILYASMSGVDHSLISAAKSLGASSWDAYRKVFAPLTKPALIGGALLSFVIALGFFLTPAVLGGNKETTMAIYIQQKVSVFEWGRASAMGICLLLATTALFAFALRVSGSAAILGRMTGSQRGTSASEPIRMNVPNVLLGVFAAAVLLFLMSPILVIVPSSFGSSTNFEFPPGALSWRWYDEYFHHDDWLVATARSGRIALIVAVVSCLISVLTAKGLAMVASPNAKSLLLAMLYAPVVAPVVLLAIGLFDVQARLGLLGTTSGLVFAHVTMSIPFAFAVISNALAGVDPNLEQAARSLGAGPIRAFTSVTLRLILPALFGAAVVAFVTSWDEVVVSQFITGLNKTLPVTIFSYLRSGVPPTVAAVGTLVIAFVIVGLAVGSTLSVVRRRRLGTIPDLDRAQG
jgi:putative spermidine/putrescine transport system permease protein